MAFYNKSSDFSNFEIGFTGRGIRELTIWGKGYWNAAQTITEKLLSDGHFPDYSCYPVIFNYRHAIELYMKGIIYDTVLISTFENKENLIETLIKSHKLLMIFEKLKRILIGLFPDDSSLIAAIDEIAIIVKEIEEIDNDSFSFRYPIDNSGRNIFSGPLIMNINAIRFACDTTLEKLDSISFMIEHIRSDISEIISEIRFE